MIPDHFTIQFGRNFTTAVQQTQSRFRKASIVETGCTGEAKTHNLVMPIEDNETTGERLAHTVLQELDTQKRWIRPQTFDLATGEPFWDEILLAPTILPGGKHLEAHLGAYNRRVDKVFIDGLFGTNYTGKNGTTESEIPAENTIEEDFEAPGTVTPGGETGLTVDKIIRAKRILTKNESYGDDARARGITLWGAMTPEMEETLLYLANASSGTAANRLFSRDFMPPTLDKDGNISFFCGVNWIRTTQLPQKEADATVQYAGIWTSDAIHLDFWKEIHTSVDRRPDLKNAAQFFSQYGLGACRSEDKKVIKIGCKVAG